MKLPERLLILVLFCCVSFRAGADTDKNAVKALEAKKNLDRVERYLDQFIHFSDEKKKQAKADGSLDKVLKYREKKCSETPEVCVAPDLLKKFICAEKAEPTVLDDVLWAQIEASAKASSKIAELVKATKACSPPLNDRQFIYLVRTMRLAARAGEQQTVRDAADFIASTWISVPKKMMYYIDLLSEAKKDFATLKPFPLDVTLKLMLLSINWVLVAPAVPALNTPTPAIESWLLEMPGLLTSTGHGEKFVSLSNKYPGFLTSSSLHIQLMMLDGLCLFLREHGKVDQCENYLTKVKANPKMQSDDGAMIQFLIQEARNAHVKGKYDEAIKILEDALKKTSAPALQAWIYGVLSISESCNKMYAQATSHIAENKRLTAKAAAPSFTWLSIYGDDVEIAMLIEQGKFAEAAPKIISTRDRLKEIITGTVDISAWLDYYELVIALQKKDTPAANTASKNLKNDVAVMPSYSFIGDLGAALMNADKGGVAELEKVKNILGPQHCEYKRAEELVKVLKTKAI